MSEARGTSKIGEIEWEGISERKVDEPLLGTTWYCSTTRSALMSGMILLPLEIGIVIVQRSVVYLLPRLFDLHKPSRMTLLPLDFGII